MNKNQSSRRTSTPIFSSITPETHNAVQPFRSLRLNKINKNLTMGQSVCEVILETESNNNNEINNPEIDNSSNILKKSISNSTSSLNKNHKNNKEINLNNNDQIKFQKDHHRSSKRSDNNYQIYENKGFRGSISTLNRSTSTINRSTSTIYSRSGTIREQYWSCSKYCCKNLTKREKILICTISVLILIIFGLFFIIGVLVSKNGKSFSQNSNTM